MKYDWINDKDSYMGCSDFEDKVPSSPGIYCIRIRKIQGVRPLRAYFVEELKKRKLNRHIGHDILYIGIASKSLKKRLSQELRAKGHGSFFRSLGSVLRQDAKKMGLNKKQYNFRFSEEDKKNIIEWINTNLEVHWDEQEIALKDKEKKLIKKYNPLMNLTHNKMANQKVLKKIKELRKANVENARKKVKELS